MDGYTSITVDEDLRDRLNAHRKDLGYTWGAYLGKLLLSYETQDEALSLDPESVQDLADELGPRIAEEVRRMRR